MAWDAGAKLLAIKAIGTVESNMKYDAINYRDPITIGIMQWYGTRAASLLNLMRATSAWVGVAPSLEADLIAQPETSRWWTERRLGQNEGESLQSVLVSDTGVQIQNAQTIDDLEDYRRAGNNFDMDAENNTNAFIFFCVMYHQSPMYAREILRTAGVSPTIVRLHAMALNHHWFKGYKTRFNTAKSIIDSGDSTGVPEWGVDPTIPTDDGGDPGTTPGTDEEPAGGSRSVGDLKRIELVGNNLHVHLGDKVVVAYAGNTGTLWMPGIEQQPGTGPVIPPPTPPNPTPEVPPGDPTTEAKLVAWMETRINRFNYDQKTGRENPDVTGFGDCSSTVRRAYRDVVGIEIGSYTVPQHLDYGKRIWSNMPGASGTKGGAPPQNLLRPGDLMFFCKHSTFDRVHHVEMVMNDTSKLIGHGGPRWNDIGPTIKSGTFADYISRNNYQYVEVKRYLP